MTIMNDEAVLGPDTIVRVRRHWNDWKIGSVPLGKLTGFQWGRTSGGVGVTSPHPMVHALMWCNELVDGEIAHSCAHGPGPHHVRVVVVKKDNDPRLVKALQRLAGLKPGKA